MSGIDINEASNYFLRYPLAQGPTALQDTTVTGNITVSGNVSITSTVQSASTTTGALSVAGGVGIVKDLYVGGNIVQDATSGSTLFTRRLRIVDISGLTPTVGESVGEEIYIYGNTWLFENKAGGGSIRYQFKDLGTEDIRGTSFSYDSLSIGQTTPAISTTTGALRVVGGISTQNNIYAAGNIIAAGPSASVGMYSSTPDGAVASTKTGLMLTSTYGGGFINEDNKTVSFGINTRHFGIRNPTRVGSMIRMDVSGGLTPIFSVLGQQVGSSATEDPTPYFTINSIGNTAVLSTSMSTSTSTGALYVAGGVGIGGNLNVGDSLRVWDGPNVGIFDQSGDTLYMSGSGSIAITGNLQVDGNVVASGNVRCVGTLLCNQIIFNDGTLQTTAITTNDIMSDCEYHTFVYRQSNPGLPKTFLSASYSLSQTPNTVLTDISANTMYFWPVYLYAGQTVRGASFWTSSSVLARVALFRGYDGITLYSMRKMITSNNITTVNNAMSYIDMPTWIVDWTGIHYVCLLPFSNTGIVSTPSNAYSNFGNTSNLSAGVLSRIGAFVAGSSIPTSTDGLTLTTLNYTAYVSVYM